MSWYGDYGYWAPRVPVGTKIARGVAAAKKLAKKEGREPCPIKVDGRKIAKTFWGLKWCENLERYGDIANRLPRGATYVRNGSVADLVIESGKVRAVVGGSEAYTVTITIQTLKPNVWKAIGNDCAQEIDSLFDLLQGRFNEGVMKRLTQAEGGLFPKKTEISMRCTCPDSAGVCKHIAAVFYGVAARLDVQPELLFKLRKVDHLELIAQATSAASLNQSLNGSIESALSDSDLGDIFGIELESTESKSLSVSTAPSKRAVRGKALGKGSVATASPAASARKRATGTAKTTTQRPAKPSKESPTKSAPKPAARKAATKSSKIGTTKVSPPQSSPAVAKKTESRPRKKKVA